MSTGSYTIFGREYPRRYDAVIIGAGVAGLFCANILAKGGMKVLLLERHFMLGGFCSTFRRKGFIFDAATHFYPLLGNPSTMTGKLVKELGIETEWARMDPVDQFHLPGMPPFQVPGELGPYIERLKHWFPEEAASIDNYFLELRQAYMYGLLYYFKGVSNDQAERLEKYSMLDKLNEHFRDERLKIILMADAPHWGSSPANTSYVFDAMLRLSYFLGNYYPMGSSQKFADDLGKAFTDRGGRILKCAAADAILVEKGKATGVRIKTVSKRDPEYFDFEAPVVVSNADALHTYRDLLSAEHRSDWMLEHLHSLKPTFACFLTHIGLRGMDPKQLADAEGYYWRTLDARNIVRDVFKIFIPTHFDPAIAPPGCQILIVQRPTPKRVVDIEDYPAYKAEVHESTMSRLRERLPGIDNHIVHCSSASHHTSYRFTNNYQGGMLGWEMSPDQLGPRRLPLYTTVDNLYLTGHWTQPGGGITPVIVSAQRVARAILTGRDDGRELAEQYFTFNSIARAQNQALGVERVQNEIA
jgi:phytoene dehydrogenase-like protein